MSYNITFGKYAGQSFEWLFFNDPSYVEWMYRNRVHRQRYKFEEEEGDYFAELFCRASHLRSTCKWCNERSVTRMSLSFFDRCDINAHIGFHCDKCERAGDGPTDYVTPSFFADYKIPRKEQLNITTCIKNHFIGSNKNLTQKSMEDFFHNDANFVDATPGFFTQEHAALFG